ncbi:uncharacterized protein BT62DRAFT_965666, partial [Guyanagaster necrorhizus]
QYSWHFLILYHGAVSSLQTSLPPWPDSRSLFTSLPSSPRSLPTITISHEWSRREPFLPARASICERYFEWGGCCGS